MNSTRPAILPDHAGSMPGRLAVPWSTVLPLAVVLSYADGFWMTTVRGAVGAVERTQTLFASWLRESAALTPVFVLAVIVAQTCALRWFRPGPRGKGTTLFTMLLTVAASTCAGIAMIVVSAAYDYHLESGQIAMMESMHGVCVGSCLAGAQQATLAAQATAVLYVSGMLLVTNLILIAWMVAMRGGRLKVSVTKQVRNGHIDAVRQFVGRLSNAHLLLVAGLLGSAAIHATVVPEHMTEWPAAGVFFAVLSAAEVAVAATAVFAPLQRVVWLSAAVISAGPIAVWLYSRTAGLPFGPTAGIPEAVGMPDVAACSLEICTLLAAVLISSARRVQQPRRASAHVRSLIVTAIISVTVIGLAGTAQNWFDNSGSSSQMHLAH